MEFITSTSTAKVQLVAVPSDTAFEILIALEKTTTPRAASTR
jgi:hypothetical protein